MSIKPLETINLVQQGAQVQAAANGGEKAGFEKALSAALGRASGGEDTPGLAAAAVRMSQLAMVRSFFSEDGVDEGGNLLQHLPLRPLIPPSGSAVGQNIDIYRQQARVENAPPASDMSLQGIIGRAAERSGVEPALLKAVIKAESSFKPDAVSPAGAEGLMQLMPGTARDLGVTDSFDPEQNVMGGARYLGGLLKKYDGDLDRALAAYNWGPGNVDRKGIEVLPSETRNYLAKVKGFYREFTG